jgi:hypothetical protein
MGNMPQMSAQEQGDELGSAQIGQEQYQMMV